MNPRHEWTLWMVGFIVLGAIILYLLDMFPPTL